MSYFIASRRFDRGDPFSVAWIQPILDAQVVVGTPQRTVGSLAQAQAFRSASASVYDVRSHDWSAETGWLQPVVDGIVRTWASVFASERSDRTPAAALYESRSSDDRHLYSAIWLESAIRWAGIWASEVGYRSEPVSRLETRTSEVLPEYGWFWPIVDQVTTTWSPTWRVGGGERSAEGSRLDVRVHEWSDESGWIQRANDLIVARWIAVFNSERSDRTADQARLERSLANWDATTGWLWKVWSGIDAVVATWVAAFHMDRTFRSIPQTVWTPGAFLDDVQWPQLFGTPYTPEAWQQVGSWLQAGGIPYDRSRSGAQLDLARGWWASPIMVQWLLDRTIQTWGPAFGSQLLADRARPAPPWQYQQGDWTPVFSWPSRVIDGIVQTWGPAFGSGLRSERSLGASPFDLRPDWGEVSAWIAPNLIIPPTGAQIWPALLQNLGLSFLPPSGQKLDLTGPGWMPTFSWPQPVIDGIISTWMPGIVLPSTTFSGSMPLVTRAAIFDVPTQGWIFANLPVDATPAQRIPALIQALGLSYRSGDRFTWDPKGMEFAPQLGWLQNVLIVPPSIAQRWPALWEATDQLFRSLSRRVYDPRGMAEWWVSAGPILASQRAAAAAIQFLGPRPVPPFEYAMVGPTGVPMEVWMRFFLRVQTDLQGIAPHNVGAAPTAGQVTLIAGSATVLTAAIRSTSLVFFQRVTSAGTPGLNTSYTIIPGISFTLQTDNIGDLSTFNWWLISPT